jgi:hypothetical protein
LLDVLYVLQPQTIPTTISLSSWRNPQIKERFSALHLADGGWICNVAAAESFSDLIADFPQRSFSLAQSDSSADDEIHDEFFSVKRVDGDRADIFVEMLIRANWMLFADIEQTPFAVERAKLDTIDAAFRMLTAWVLGTPGRPVSRVTTWTSSGTDRQSMQRWIRGHQIFAALTQGLIAAFTELKSALIADDAGPTMGATVDLAVALLHGAGASFEFTGDMPSDDYMTIIRPSMTPPLVPDSFSGLLSSDHRVLVGMLRGMKPLLDSLHERRPEAHARIADALSEVYDSHRFVCERLVGKSPSLMMSTVSTKTGGDQIEKFKRLRMKAFEPSPAARVHNGIAPAAATAPSN